MVVTYLLLDYIPIDHFTYTIEYCKAVHTFSYGIKSMLYFEY